MLEEFENVKLRAQKSRKMIGYCLNPKFGDPALHHAFKRIRYRRHVAILGKTRKPVRETTLETGNVQCSGVSSEFSLLRSDQNLSRKSPEADEATGSVERLGVRGRPGEE